MTLQPDELEQVVATARRFVEDRLVPLERDVESSGVIPDDVWQQLVSESVRIGLYSANVPERLGGPGLTVTEQLMLWEEFGRTLWPFSYLLGRAHSVLFHCSPDQQERFLDPVLAGTKEQCFALTEPGAGSDNSAMRTRATKVDGGYRITGTKHFISHGRADFAVVFAVTGPPPSGRRTPEITAFLVERDSPGYSVGGIQPMVGWWGMEERELSFDEVFVPDENVLGAPGDGLRLALSSVGHRRLQIAAYCVGAMERVLSLTVQYAKDRVVAGEPLIDKQGIAWMLAEMAVGPYTAREVNRRAAARFDAVRASGDDDLTASQTCGMDISIAKLHATRALSAVADLGVQIHGGMGLAREYPIERFYRDSRIFRIVDGTDEVHKTIIAKQLAKRPATTL